MKAKIATLAISAFMLISLISVMAVAPVSAQDGAVRDRTTAITVAADRLVDQQNPDGGFRMWISETPPGTYLRTHNIGVTAIGILKAHELLDKTEYETALAKTYKFVVNHEPGWIQDPKDNTKWKESPGGVNSWPDIHFLIDLAEAAASDSSLLAAIESEVPGTTASDILALAKERWDDRLNHAGAVYPSEVGTATGMAEWLVYVRVPDWASLIPWDLEAAVKSALAIHEKYPEDGYLAQAQEIAEVIYDCIYGDPSYLDINDPEEKCYTLGLAGAIEAFTEAGLYPDEASELKTLLIEYQSDDGYWDASELSDQESVQATAYSIMALITQGDDDARTAAVKGSNWLVNTQDELGGWDPSSLESGDECLEVDGEAAWALATAEAPVTIGEDGYYSIQSAIDAAEPGDTIMVAAGIYPEKLVILADKPHIKLIGAGSDVTTIDISSGGGIAILTRAPITVEGFHIQGPGRGTGTAIKVEGHPGTDQGSGTADNPGVFKNNKVSKVNYGLQSGDWHVQYWEFIGNDFSELRIGIGLEDMEYVKVIGNTFKDYKEGVSMGWDSDTASNVEIKNNKFLGNQPESDRLAAIVISSAATDITVSGNDITNSIVGVLIKVKDQASNEGHEGGLGTVHINYNNIVNNVLGVKSEAFIKTIGVDATLNWWGSDNGPSTSSNTFNVGQQGDSVSANVDFTPWLDAAYPVGVPFAPVVNENTGETFSSIQAAIDAASSGDTVLVYPGTYGEYILIDKPLTVKSTDGAEETIIDGIGFRYMVRIYSSDVTFEGFTVTNPTYEGGADASGILIGTYLVDPVDNVHILNNIVKAVRSGTTGTPSTFGATGINIGRGPLSNVVVSGNTIENIKNPEGGASDHTCGINVWDGAENVLISNNAISDIKYNGIMLECASNVQIENNSITECETGIRVEPYEGATVSDLTIHLNTFESNGKQLIDASETLDIAEILANNTFDRAVIVETASYLPFIWSSIQEAIDNASSDDTVIVGPGTYEEEIKIMDKSLTLLGAQADVPIVNGERAGDESVIRGKGTGGWKYSWCVVRIQNSNVVINGFTIGNGQRAIAIQGSSIRREGISDILVSHNYIENSGKDGIFRDTAAADVTITHNYIASNPRGIATNGGGTTITNNTFYGNGKGIDFWGGDPYDRYFPDYAEPKYPTIIDNNTFTDDSTSITLRLDKCHQSITITGNDITEARSVAIKTWNTYDVDLVNPAIHYNNIAGNEEYGVLNTTKNKIDATYNWWGHPNGPRRGECKGRSGRGDRVSNKVRYRPWLTKPFQTVLEEHVGYYGSEGPCLEKGWNTFSAPIYLDNNAWEGIAAYLDENIAYRFNASTQAWELMTTGSKLDPLDSIYIRMNSEDNVPLVVSVSITNPPVKELKRGWNLVGLAVWEEENMSVDRALVSVEQTPDGNRGYTIVVSSSLNQEYWAYTIGQPEKPLMYKNKGYWVYMENPDNLAGFSTTPLPFWEPE